MLAWCDLLAGADAPARDRLAGARASAARCPGSPASELRIVDRVLRARSGSRAAIAELEGIAVSGSPWFLPIDPDTLRAVARSEGRVAVTRRGPRVVTSAA